MRHRNGTYATKPKWSALHDNQEKVKTHRQDITHLGTQRGIVKRNGSPTTRTTEQEDPPRVYHRQTRRPDSFIASNQTGAFPRVSNRGNKYICVFYVYESNFIKGIAIKSRHKSELLGAYTKVYKWCKSRGFKPKLHRMDNKTSNDVKEFIKAENTNLQYTAPGKHCAPAEKAMQT